jgi:predicted Holliday junction resolvase-like endonuclease
VYKHNHFSKLIAEYQNNLNHMDDQLANLQNAITALRDQHMLEVNNARADSVNKSRSVIRGQATEHMAPMLMGGFNVRDFRFIGNPIDYLCVDGLSDMIDGVNGEDSVSIYLVDIKSGKANLTKTQRKIRDAVVEGRVKFVCFNPDTNSYREWPEPKPPTPIQPEPIENPVVQEDIMESFDLIPDLNIEEITYSGPATIRIPQDN